MYMCMLAGQFICLLKYREKNHLIDLKIVFSRTIIQLILSLSMILQRDHQIIISFRYG